MEKSIFLTVLSNSDKIKHPYNKPNTLDQPFYIPDGSQISLFELSISGGIVSQDSDCMLEIFDWLQPSEDGKFYGKKSKLSLSDDEEFPSGHSLVA